MNSTYRIIWSQVHQAYIVTGELAKTAGKVSNRRRSLLAAAVAGLLGVSAPLLAEVASGALPQGGQISVGQGSITQLGNQLRVQQQSQQLITNWQSFSIGSGAKVEFIQPGSDSVALNRVVGANPSALLGQLQANGRVYLINPNGVVVGPDAHINTAAFLASALDLSDADFLADGGLLLAGDSKQAVVNLGQITASNGDVILVAYQVSNAGSIEAPNGVAGLVAGSAVIYTPQGEQTLLVKAKLGDGVAPGAVGVANSGVIAAAQAELKAAGGSVYELAINQSGVVRATGSATRHGRVLLTAEGGSVVHSGTIAAHNADGSGGEVLIGGDYRGGNPDVANAAHTLVSADALIDVSADSAQGDGGRVVVWAEQATRFLGTIRGTGGSLSGDGGFAEVSGKQILDFQGLADLRAPAGSSGTLLLDPASLTVVAVGADTNLALSGSNPLTDGPAGTLPSTLSVATLEGQLATSNVILDTSYVYDPSNSTADGSILLSDAVSWSSGNSLTFNSGNNITINANLNGGSGDIIFALGFIHDGATMGGRTLTANLNVASAASVSANSVTIKRNATAQLELSNGSFGPMGNIDFAGPLLTNLLDIQIGTTLFLGKWLEDEGISGTTRIDNPANQIGTLASTVTGGAIAGPFTLVDGAGGLNVTGSFLNVGGPLSITTSGNLTLDAGSALSTAVDQDIYLAAQAGSFINNAAANAVATSGSGRFLIYSDAPAKTVKGGLVGNPVYNKSYAANAPASITQTGDRFLYTLAPLLSFSADPASRSYGDANPAFSYSVSGLVGGDLAADVYSGTPALSATQGPSSGAGSYLGAISVGQGGVLLSDYDYQFAGVAGTLTIDKALLTVTPNAATRLYGDADPSFSGTLSGFKNGETAAVVTTQPSYASSAVVGSNVGLYDIIASGAADENYRFSYLPGSNLLSVTAAPLTVTANNASRLYGAGNPAFSASFSGLKAGDAATDFPALGFSTPDSTVGSNVGSGYLIRPAGASNANYSYSYVDGALSITPAPLTVMANNAAHVFDGAVPAPTSYTASFSGLVAGDQASSYTTQLSFSSTTDGSATGQFPISVSGVSDANYSVSYLPGTLTISNQILTVRALDTTRLYGAANPAFGASISGFVGSDDAAVLLTPVSFSTAAVSNSPVGTYSIIPAGASAANYDFSFVSGTLTVDPALLTIRADSASRLYGGADPLFSASFIGLTAGDVAGDITGLSFTTDAQVGSGVGAYTITPANASSANYTISYQAGALSITPAPLTITANAKSRLYGAADPLFDAHITGLVAGDSSAAITGLTLTSDALTNSNVGSGYRITPSGAVNANYAINYVDGALSITPAPLSISANNARRTFGDANPAFSARVTGLVAGDGVDKLGNTIFLTSASAHSNVGSYAVTPAGSVNGNYDISNLPGTLTIDPRALTISADSQSSVFGDALPAYTLSFDNLASFHTMADLGNPSATGVSGSLNNVGSYPIDVVGGANANYTITRTSGSLTITPRPVTVTAQDMSRVYGDANPAFLINVTNQAPGAPLGSTGLSFSTLAQTSSNVGGYALTPSGIVNPNYSLSYVDGTLSVTPAPLNFNAVDQRREYGLANPALSYVDASGYKLGQTLADVLANVTLTTSASQGSNVGAYSIVLAADIINSNYAVSLNPATLTVTKAPLYVVPALSSRLYGDPDPAFVLTASGLRNGDTAAVVTGEQFQSNTPAFAGVGSYPVSVLYAYANNYTLSYGSGSMNVLPRPLTISADNVSREYGEANPVFSASLSGLASFDTSAVIPGVAVSTTATAASNVLAGGYGLNPTSGTNANYAISYQSGRLDITPAPLLISVDNATRQYATANPSFSGSVISGLKLSDTLGDLLLSYSTQATPSSNVGNYPIAASVANPNYTPVGTLGSLSITPAPLTLLIDSALTLDRIYGDASVDFGAALNVAGLQFGAQAAAVVSVVDPTNAATPIGSYALQATLLDPNYRLQSFARNGFVIQQRHISLTFAGATRRYGDAEPDLLGFLDTSGLFAPGDSPANVFSPITTATAQNSAVGDYPIQVSSINSNYGIDAVYGSLSITPRPLRVDLGQINRVYGEPDPASLDHLRVSGQPYDLMPFDTLASVLDIALPPQQAGVGTYTLSAQPTSANYTLLAFGGQLSVTPRPIVVGVPADYARTYGDPNPSVGLTPLFDPTVAGSGLTSFDSLSDLVTLSLPGEQVAAGSYQVPPVVNAQLAANYRLTLTRPDGLTVQVNPRPLGLDFHDTTRRYGEENSVLGSLFDTVALAGVSGGQGLARFDSYSSLFTTSLPDVTAGVGTYNPTTLLGNPNYAVTLSNGSGTLTIEARPIGLYIYPKTRLFGDDNSALGRLYDPIVMSSVAGAQGLAAFDSYDAVLAVNLPDATAEGGIYHPVTLVDNPNYAPILMNDGALTIMPRNLAIGGRTLYKDYGDSGFAFTAVAGDGLAAFDTPAGVFTLDLPTPVDQHSPAGYYPLAGYSLNHPNNYKVSSFTPEVFTVLPRQVSLTIANQALSFDDAGALNSYLADPDRVFSATLGNLAAGESIDDAFPIIRYQVVESDAVPALPIVPTPDNIVIPPRALLELNPELVGHGVRLDPSAVTAAATTPAVVRTSGDFQTADAITLERFATVYDGLDTEHNYVLTQVSNGRVSLRVPSAVASDPFGLSSFVPTSERPDVSGSGQPLVVGSKAHPPGLQTLFNAGDGQLATDMILGYLQTLMGDGGSYAFPEGGLLAEITRGSDGTLADVTPFRIQRWLERNADNPQAMALLNEPLAHYAKEFVNKDPAGYTAEEAQFADLLGRHLQSARDGVVQKSREKHDEWVAAQADKPSSTATFGMDPPWGDFISEAAGDYVADDLDQRIAITSGASAGAGVATGLVIATFTSFIMPHAFTAAGTVGLSTSILAGSVGGTGATMAVGTAAAVVALPAVMVAAAVAGSIVRTYQMFDNAKQKENYDVVMASYGDPIVPSSFSLTHVDGEENVLNGTIMVGALTSLLYP